MAIPNDMIGGDSPEIQSIRNILSRVANSDVATLISGESGVGKTSVAMTIHQMSRRAGESLSRFDCATTSDEFLEAELFGYEESGRVKRGLLETANGSTFLLQNIDQIPLQLQAKLLRVFQDREFRRRGGLKDLRTDCRFIGTCLGGIKEKVQASLFREDLYYRLNVVSIYLPPLRDRPEDIRPLLRQLAIKVGVDADQFMGKLHGHGLMECFEKYSWPGNIKELQRIVEMLVLTERWGEIKGYLLRQRTYSSQIVIERCIEFPPEYHQAGISILSFFGEVLRRKYPDKQATIRIEQDGLRVRMMIEPFVGEPEVFERALDQFGLVLIGRITPEEFTEDSLLVISLKHELRLAQARIESQKELLQLHERNTGRQNRNFDQLTSLIATAFSSPPVNQVNVTVSPVITSSVNVDLAVSTTVGDISRDLGALSAALRSSGSDASSVEEVSQEFEKLRKSGSDEVKSSTAFSKLGELLEKISNAESKIGKAISVLENGVMLAKRLAGHYNDVAQWLNLPLS